MIFNLTYSHVQRLYQALTSTFEAPNVPEHPTLPGLPAPSLTHYSYVPAGPGLAKPTPDSGRNNYPAYEFTGLRIVTKDRIPTSEARWKGIGWKTGDYVHLINPDDPARPLVGQIFRSFIHAKSVNLYVSLALCQHHLTFYSIDNRGPKQHWITVCWYYRPEQTWHNPMQMFYDREVCKTGTMVEHPVEDIIERVGCQFYTKVSLLTRSHRVPNLSRGMFSMLEEGLKEENGTQAGRFVSIVRCQSLEALLITMHNGTDICNSRYNEDRRGDGERGNHFVKIKNWGSCVPEVSGLVDS